MCLKNWCAAVLLLAATCVCVGQTPIVPTTTLAAQKANNTSASDNFSYQTNGNMGANNVSKADIHSLLYPGASTKVYAHLMLWFGGSNHMNVGYSSADAGQVRRQVNDMISRGIDGVILDWYGPNNSIDDAAKLVMSEAELHPGFTFAIMVDQGAIEWNSCSGCSPQAALIDQLQYVEQTYFPSKAYMTLQGKPVVTNFNIDLSYSVNWNEVTQALSSQPAFIFQNNDGFSHVLSQGSYSWVMPTTSDYGMNYLGGFYDTGLPLQNEETIGAAYKGFNDSLASWGSNRVMGQQCGQTWLQTFSKVNEIYDSGKQLSALQLVTWNDYEEATEIESGIDNCVSVSASISGNRLQWSISGDESTIDHYVPYISRDGQKLMSLGQFDPGTRSLDLCSYSFADRGYTLYVQAVAKPAMTNRISGAVNVTLNCSTGASGGVGSGSSSSSSLSVGASPSSVTITSGKSGSINVTVATKSGSFNDAVALACSGLPATIQCSFSPESITPGAVGATSVMTLTASPVALTRHGGERRNYFIADWLFGVGLFGIVFTGKINRRRIVQIIGACAAAAIISSAVSCGGNVSNSSSAGGASSTYVVTISGNAASQQLSTTISVTVQQ